MLNFVTPAFVIDGLFYTTGDVLRSVPYSYTIQ